MLQAYQSFNDGLLKIFKMESVSLPGDMPVDKLVIQNSLRYEEQTLGLTRYFSAMQNGIRVSTVVRCPRIRNLSTTDKDLLIAVLNDGSQYEVTLIQWPKETEPPSMDLTLVRSEDLYVIE